MRVNITAFILMRAGEHIDIRAEIEPPLEISKMVALETHAVGTCCPFRPFEC